SSSRVPIMALLSPIVYIRAIVCLYIGHALGAVEGARFFVKKFAPSISNKLSMTTLTVAINVFIFLTAWTAAIANPSILALIESIGGPFIAMILYIMPMYAMYKVPALNRFRNH